MAKPGLRSKALGLLGLLERGPSVPRPVLREPGTEIDQRYDVQEYRKRLTEVLKRLCRLGFPFWYASACIWFLGEHKDKGTMLLPGPLSGFDLPYGAKQGLR